MTKRNVWRSPFAFRRNRYANQVLVSLSTILLFFCLSAANSSRQAFGGPSGVFQQSTRQARDKESNSGDKKEVRKLRKDKPIKGGLVMGQEHAYRIELDAGEFLKVIVEQKGIDLAPQVLGTDGKPIMEFDSENSLQGREEVALVAEAAGDFQLIVRPKQYGRPAGSYEIRIEELRDATEADRALQDARRQLEEALKLKQAGKYDEAFPLAERALEIRERWLGAKHRDVAAAINSLANIHTDKGEYAKAEPLYQRALAIREKAPGKDHPDTAQSLNDLANLYCMQGKYEEAETLYKRAIEIRETALGKDHPDTAESLNNLSALYREQGKYVGAELLNKRALAINEKALGKDHPGAAKSLHTLADVFLFQRKYGEAESLYKRALAIREKALGKDHPDTATTLNNLAQLCLVQGKYEESELLFKRALDIREKVLGKTHPAIALSLNAIAFLYEIRGNQMEAESLYKRALEIYENTLGKDHPHTAKALNNLAKLCRAQGKYEEAEPLFKRALDIRKKALGNDNPVIAGSLVDLGSLYRRQGKYEEAESLFKRALDIFEKTLDKDHPNIARCLQALAYLYAAKGKYAEAESLYKRALDIREKKEGKDNIFTASCINDLGELYRKQKKYAEAETLYKRALAIREKALGKDHLETAVSLNSLGVLYARMGKYEESEPFLKRALANYEKAGHKDTTSIATILNNLALAYTARGDLVQAAKFLALANAASERNLARNIVIGSERDKFAYLARLSTQNDQTLSFHIQSAPDDPLARNLAATLILQRKGRILDATSQNLNALRSRFNLEDRALLDRLTETRSEIARLVLSGPQKMSAERHQARIKELEDQAQKDEADISRRSKEFLAQYLPVTLEAIQAAIPPDSALIEFASYSPLNAKDITYGQPRYVAYVLLGGGEIKFKELGAAKAIDESITALRNALRNQKSVDAQRLARAVDEKVFQPIRPLLGAKSRLLISPDGSLNLIPFAALVDEAGRYAIERYSISYLTSGRDLLRLQVARESKDAPLVVAAPDFGSRSQVESGLEKQGDDVSAGGARKESSRSAINDFYFPPLPAAEREGEALRSLLPGATLLTKGQATKAALSQVHGPRLLHVATHGFFLEDQDFTTGGERGAQALGDDPDRALVQLEQQGAHVESPLLRSGLVLAGANEHKEDDNGILTALEVTGLNLWGTKLVTLSACDTGVGEVKNGDGVYGLRRALLLAGAETQIMSLWSVSDKAALELMVSYYRKLQEGQGRGDALRQAQLEMLRKENRRHPYYWACFIQSGEWANLDGKR